MARLNARSDAMKEDMEVKDFSLTGMFSAVLKREDARDVQMGERLLDSRNVGFCTFDELRDALAARQFRIVYQPKVWAHNRKLAGAEALVRWDHPLLGVLGPDLFIASAESTGMIHELGAWVLREVAKFAGVLERGNHGFPGKLAVNVSPVQFSNAHYITALVEATEALGLPVHLLEFEVTETSVFENLEKTLKLMNMLHSHGIHIAIDDFGRGYSSIQHLASLPISVVKLDRGFVAQIETSEANRKIVKGMLRLCRELGIETVAEGVEREQQATMLTDWGCDMLQGWLFGRPLAREDFVRSMTL